VRIAVVSDIHGNLPAFEAVLADLRQTSPDLILHGGDLADAGAHPIEIIDQLRDLNWPGVMGNTDDMLANPQSLATFAAQSPFMQSILPMLEDMAAWTRDCLGEQRLAWLRSLPLTQPHSDFALVHASPDNCWRSPNPSSPDADLESTYAPLGRPLAVYGHVHRGFIRTIGNLTVANSGSVSQSYDGDPRASYLLIDNGKPELRRVAYGVEKEIDALHSSTLPHAAWITKILRAAGPQMP
jgi:putative phosphoesterase